MTKPLRLADLHAMLEKWMPASAQPLPLRPVRSKPHAAADAADRRVTGAADSRSRPSISTC